VVSAMSSSVNVTIDTVAPAAPVVQSYSTSTGAGTPTISGTAPAYTTITVYRTASSGQRAGARSWSVTRTSRLSGTSTSQSHPSGTLNDG